jgi:betaine-aldehyde dehydrogenase
MYERENLYIGGRWVAPAEGGVLDVISPSTEQVIGRAPLASAADVDGAVAAAREAFDSGPWPRTSPEVRAAALASMAAYLTDRARPLAELNIDEPGVPITFAHARELGPVAVFNYFVNLTRTFPFREIRPGAMAPALVVREPAGVVGAVVPFNGPIMSAAAKIAPALAAGCTIVFKPAPETPLDAFVLGGGRCGRWRATRGGETCCQETPPSGRRSSPTRASIGWSSPAARGPAGRSPRPVPGRSSGSRSNWAARRPRCC